MVAAIEAVDAKGPKGDGGRNKDRLVVHLGSRLKKLVLQAAKAYSIASGGIKVTQTDIARLAFDHCGIVREKDGPKLRPLDASMVGKGGQLIPEVDETRFNERIFLPNSPKWKRESAEIAQSMSNITHKVHPSEVGRAVILSALRMVDGKAELRPPLQ